MSRLPVSSLALLALVGCLRVSEPQPAPARERCVPGEALGCECAEGVRGAIRCEDPSWGPCRCSVDRDAALPEECTLEASLDGGLEAVCGGERSWSAPEGGVAAPCTLQSEDAGRVSLRCGDASATLLGPRDAGSGRPLRTLAGSAVIRNDIDALFVAQFERIDGQLVVEGTSLELLSLPALREVGAGVRVAQNTALVTLSLPQLTEVGALLEVTKNAQLRRVELPQLAKLTALGEDPRLTVEDNPALALWGLPELAGSRLHMRVLGRANLRVELPKLTKLNSIQLGCAAWLELAPGATAIQFTLDAQGACEDGWSIEVRGLEQTANRLAVQDKFLRRVQLPDLRRAHALSSNGALALQELRCERLEELQELSLSALELTQFQCEAWLPALRSLRTLALGANPKLQSVQCERLTEATQLSITSNTVLQRLAFPALQKASIIIERNPVLTEVTLPILTSAPALRIAGNGALRALALPALQEAATAPRVFDEPQLASLDMPGLGIGPDQVHYGNLQLFEAADVAALEQRAPQYVAGNLSLVDTALSTFSARTPRWVAGDVRIAGNALLTELTLPGLEAANELIVDAAPALVSVQFADLHSANLRITSNARLTRIEAEGWTTGNLTVSSNESLLRFALPAREGIVTKLDISRNPALRSFSLPLAKPNDYGICQNAKLPECFALEFGKRRSSRRTCEGNNNGVSSCPDACCEGAAP